MTGAEEFRVEAAVEHALARLGERFTVGPVETSERTLVARDTFDGLVRAAGVELLLEEGEPVPEPALAAAGRRALLELARITVHVRRVALLDELDKTVVRVEWLAADGLSERWRLRSLRGYAEEAAAVRDLLGAVPVERSLFEEAMLAAGRPPEGVSAKVSVALAPEEPAAVAVARVLRALWDVIAANWEGTVEGIDVEFLHDLRVCLRKSRAVLKEFPGVYSPADRERWRAELKWLQGVTGETRDLDVNLEDFNELAELVGATDRAALEPVRAVLDARRATARRSMVRQLRGPRARTLLTGWPAFLADLEADGGQTHASAPDAARAIDHVAGERILKVYRRMVKAGRRLGPGSAADEYHELRKQGKELRYLLELFGAPLHDPAVVKPMTRALKDLQDVLGRHQDREVQAATLRGLAGAVARRPGGPEALIAVGALVIALGEDERAARAAFAEAFEVFASPEQRSRVRTTFGRS